MQYICSLATRTWSMLWILSYVSPSNMHNTPSYTYICGMRPCSNLMPTLKMLSDPNGGPTSTHTRCSIALAVYYNAKRTGSTAWQFLRWNTRIVHALLCFRYSSTFRLYLRYSESLHGVTVATRWQYIVCVAARCWWFRYFVLSHLEWWNILR